MSLNRQGKGGQASPMRYVLLLSLFFLGGVCLGQVLAEHIPVSAGQELESYLRGYVELEQSVSPMTALSAWLLYVRYPLLAVLLGCSFVGVVLLPCVTVVFGLCLSFSISCFMAVFGTEGVLLAFALLGVRCFVTLPCYFLLAAPALGNAAMLAGASFGRGRRFARISRRTGEWTRLAVCCLILVAGVCAELFCTPLLSRLALERMFP